MANSNNILYFSIQPPYVVGTHNNSLTETILLSTNNIGFECQIRILYRGKYPLSTALVIRKTLWAVGWVGLWRWKKDLRKWNIIYAVCKFKRQMSEDPFYPCQSSQDTLIQFSKLYCVCGGSKSLFLIPVHFFSHKKTSMNLQVSGHTLQQYINNDKYLIVHFPASMQIK